MTDEEILTTFDRWADNSSDPPPFTRQLTREAAALIRRLQSERDAYAQGRVGIRTLVTETDSINDRDARAAMQSIMATEWGRICEVSGLENCDIDAEAALLAVAIRCAWQTADIMAAERARRKGDAK